MRDVIPLWRLLHLAGLALWLGCSAGAWIVYRRARRDGQARRAFPWIEAALRAAHTGLATAIVAGAGVMVHARIWPPPDWLLWKLVLAGLLVIPVAAANAYIVHFWMPRDLADGPPEEVLVRFDRWATLTGPLLAATATAIAVLAVLKP